jgi:hypothetical protein
MRREDTIMSAHIRRRAFISFLLIVLSSLAITFFIAPSQAQTASASAKLSVHWEELTASDFREGIHRSQGTCLLPFGILEKH